MADSRKRKRRHCRSAGLRRLRDLVGVGDYRAFFSLPNSVAFANQSVATTFRHKLPENVQVFDSLLPEQVRLIFSCPPRNVGFVPVILLMLPLPQSDAFCPSPAARTPTRFACHVSCCVTESSSLSGDMPPSVVKSFSMAMSFLL
jgi:hypothetical protein